MKKILLTGVFVALAFITAHAQIGAGTIAVGGNLEISSRTTKYKFSSGSADGPTNSSFAIGPQASYFLSDEFSVGARISFVSNKTENATGNTKTTTNSFVFSPLARYHIPMGERFYFFGQGRLDFAFAGGKTKTGGVSIDGDPSNMIGLAVSPGILFFPGEKIGIEMAFDLLSFHSQVSKDADDKDNKTVSNTFSFGPDLFSPSLSIQFYF